MCSGADANSRVIIACIAFKPELRPRIQRLFTRIFIITLKQEMIGPLDEWAAFALN